MHWATFFLPIQRETYKDQAQAYKTFFMLNSTELKIATAHKTNIPAKKKLLALSY